MSGPKLPCRFQVGDAVRVGAMRGCVVGVTFTAWEVFYDVEHASGTLYRMPAESVQARQPNLRVVDSAADTSPVVTDGAAGSVVLDGLDLGCLNPILPAKDR